MAQKLIENGIDFFAVSEVNEAVRLKSIGITQDILVMNSTSIYDEVRLMVQNNFIASCGSFDTLKVLQKVASEENTTIRCHLKIDTGFSRFGFLAQKILDDEKYANELKAEIEKSTNVMVTGTYTHFKQSYETKSKVTLEQFDLFIKTTNHLKEMGLELGMLHCANSHAFLKYPQMFLDAVRIGSAFSGRVHINGTRS
jgi:alanine racemase